MTAVRTSVAVLTIMLFAVSLASAGEQAGRFRVDPLTATIVGRVTSDTGGPLRRAEVRAISETGLTRLATTDAEGQYLVRDLPAGTFTLHVSKTGFVPLYFGQNRPFEQRTTIRLAQGQRFAADVRLPRAGAMTGRIFDRAGEPVLGARVQALRRRVIDGKAGLQVTGATDTTDDTGAYRLYGLPPGEYYVTATPRQIEDRSGRLVSGAVPGRGAPIFYPGTANRDEAQRVSVSVSGEARADMNLFDVPTSRVSGIVLNSSGAPAAGAMVSLVARDLDFSGSGPNESLLPLRIQTDAAPDGTFELTGVPPGSFILRVQTRVDISTIGPAPNRNLDPDRRFVFIDAPALESALVPITVVDDVTRLSVTTVRPGTMDVVFAADDGVTAPLPRGARLTVRTGERSESLMTSHGAAGDAMMVVSLAVASRVTVEGLPPTWAVKTISLDGEDVTDQPIDVKGRQQAVLRVVLTDRVTEVVGSIASSSFAGGGKAPRATIVVFADDETKWSFPSRFIQTARTDAQGAFQVTGLPPQEYRVIAVDYLEDGEESDPEFLKRMRERGTRFSLREGERRAVELRLIPR